MASFEHAIEYVLANEGQDDPTKPDPHDPGGATAFGITHGVLADHKRSHGSDCPLAATLIVELDRDGAVHVYEHEFWLPQLNALTSQRLATKIFDACVNLSPYWATVCLQRALNNVGVVPALATDGKFGARTTVACNTVPVETILDSYVSELCKYYSRVTRARLLKTLPVLSHPGVNSAMRFQEGWLGRAARKPHPSQDRIAASMQLPPRAKF